jgi:hypothetical protein
LLGLGVLRRHAVVGVLERLDEWILFNRRRLQTLHLVDFFLQLGKLRLERLDSLDLCVEQLLQRRGLLSRRRLLRGGSN